MISIENLEFEYNDKVIFKDLNLKIKSGEINTIIGPNGSGKSTLVKILTGLVDYNGSILIDDLVLKDNIEKIRKEIGVVFEDPDSQFVCETVIDDLVFTLKNMGYKKAEIKNKINNIAELLDVKSLLNQEILNLNTNQKMLVSLANALVHDIKILILDEALTSLDPKEKEKMLELLKKLKKEKITIINITHDIEQTLISDKIFVLNNGEIVLKGNKNKVYKSEKLLNDLGFKLPFMVELSNRLIFYGLIDHIVYDMKDLVNILWK